MKIMSVRWPALVTAIMLCASAGAANGAILVQSEAAPLPPDTSAQSERLADPGLAPPMPYVGRGSSAGCDVPDAADHPRCREWLQAYKEWRRAYDAYHKHKG